MVISPPVTSSVKPSPSTALVLLLPAFASNVVSVPALARRAIADRPAVTRFLDLSTALVLSTRCTSLVTYQISFVFYIEKLLQ